MQTTPEATQTTKDEPSNSNNKSLLGTLNQKHQDKTNKFNNWINQDNPNDPKNTKPNNQINPGHNATRIRDQQNKTDIDEYKPCKTDNIRNKTQHPEHRPQRQLTQLKPTINKNPSRPIILAEPPHNE